MAELSHFRVEHPEELNRVVTPMTRKVAEELSEDTARNTPVQTGRLQSGWRVVADSSGRWMVTNDVAYGRFVEYGTHSLHPVGMLGAAVSRARQRYG